MLLVRSNAQKANDVEHCRALHGRLRAIARRGGVSAWAAELLLVDADVGEYEHEHEHVDEHEYEYGYDNVYGYVHVRRRLRRRHRPRAATRTCPSSLRREA